MKYVFVVGFYDSIKDILDEKFPGRLAEGSIIWIAENKGIKADLEKFKELFFDVISSGHPSAVVVLFGIPKGHDWLPYQLERIVTEGRARDSSAKVDFLTSPDLNARNLVEMQIEAAQLDEREEIPDELVRAKLNGRKAICIHASTYTSIKDALKRAGFSPEIVEERFDEESINIAKNSNLNERLAKYAKSHFMMLYAWDGLRHASDAVVAAFRRNGKFIDAQSASKVVEKLRRWLLS
jgi:hypothetical protein